MKQPSQPLGQRFGASVEDIGASGLEAIGPCEEVRHRIWVRLGTLVAVQGANLIHLFLRQLEVKEISIRSHASRGGALGDDLDLSLQEPTQDHLCTALALGFCDAFDLRRIHGRGGRRKLRSVRLAATQGRVGGDGNIAAEAVVHKGVAHVEGVHFDLVHGRLHTCLEPKVMQEHQREVAHTDGANFFLIDQLLHGSPRVNEWCGAELGAWAGRRWKKTFDY